MTCLNKYLFHVSEINYLIINKIKAIIDRNNISIKHIHGLDCMNFQNTNDIVKN